MRLPMADKKTKGKVETNAVLKVVVDIDDGQAYIGIVFEADGLSTMVPMREHEAKHFVEAFCLAAHAAFSGELLGEGEEFLSLSRH